MDSINLNYFKIIMLTCILSIMNITLNNLKLCKKLIAQDLGGVVSG